MEKIIHLRYIPRGKIQWTIPLNLKYKNIDIDEDMEAECSSSENIGFFLEQTKKEIRNIINRKLAETSAKIEIEYDHIQISLIRKRQQGYKIIPEDLTISVIMLQDHKNSRMTIFDQEYEILVNSPKIKTISLAPVLYASFSVSPIKFDGLYVRKSLCIFNWYRSKDKIHWETLDDRYSYTIKFEDIGYFLKLICRPFSSQNIEGPSAEVISKGVVLECPKVSICPYDIRPSYTKNIYSLRSFRLVSYNTLSSRYTYTDDKYSYCPDEYLVMDYRKQLILREILGYDADIVCLQEVDENVYSSFFKPVLEIHGYSSKFYRKGYYLSEGLMCAIRKSHFKLKAYELMVFSEALKKKSIFYNFYKMIKNDRSFLKKFGMQSSSMEIMTLKCEQKIILVGNIHLSHDPLNDDIRLIHSFMAISYLNYMKETLQVKHPTFTVSIILCGDFNSPPDSGLYNFICKGYVDKNSYVMVAGMQLSFQHELNLKSACGTPKYTCFTPTFKNCIDYIFVEDAAFLVQHAIPFPDKELENSEGIPNKVFPSDHLALVADIKFTF